MSFTSISPMTGFILDLNFWGGQTVRFAWPMLVQSTLLIAFLLVLDLVLRKRVRAVFRYGLWLLVLIKLVLPPSFASPTGLGYWLTLKQPDKPVIASAPVHVTVTYSDAEPIYIPSTTPLPAYRPALTWPGIFLLAWAGVAFGLVFWLFLRARFVARMSARARDAPKAWLELLESCCQQLEIKRPIRLKFSIEATSPAVCGLGHPTILIPVQLADKLSALPMRAVLLHELSHIKRGDLWVNYAQTLLQIFYWYNPLLWLANAVIRRVREQAVDEMVMVEMGQEADAYPITLLEVAKLTFTRSVMSLGLVGIMESKNALNERIKHLLSRPAPKNAKLGLIGMTAILFLGALLVPMARGQRRVTNVHPQTENRSINPFEASKAPTASMDLLTRLYKVDTNSFLQGLQRLTGEPSKANMVELLTGFRDYLIQAGVNLEPPKAAWYSRNGFLKIRATLNDLDTIEQILVELDSQQQPANAKPSIPSTENEAAETEFRRAVGILTDVNGLYCFTSSNVDNVTIADYNERGEIVARTANQLPRAVDKAPAQPLGPSRWGKEPRQQQDDKVSFGF